MKYNLLRAKKGKIYKSAFLDMYALPLELHYKGAVVSVLITHKRKRMLAELTYEQIATKQFMTVVNKTCCSYWMQLAPVSVKRRIGNGYSVYATDRETIAKWLCATGFRFSFVFGMHIGVELRVVNATVNNNCTVTATGSICQVVRYGSGMEARITYNPVDHYKVQCAIAKVTDFTVFRWGGFVWDNEQTIKAVKKTFGYTEVVTNCIAASISNVPSKIETYRMTIATRQLKEKENDRV